MVWHFLIAHKEENFQMCGINFCGPCQDETVKQWAQGLIHETPRFGDDAQHCLAYSQRSSAFNKLLLENSPELANFPELEWKLLQASSLYWQLSRYGPLITSNLEVPDFLTPTNKNLKSRKRKAYFRRFSQWLKHQRKWEKTVIASLKAKLTQPQTPAPAYDELVAERLVEEGVFTTA